MIKAIIFDFDGTLSNRSLNSYNTLDPFLRTFFKDFSDDEYEAIVQDFLSYDCNGTITYDFRVKPFIHKYKQYLPDNFEEIYTEYFKGNMYRYAVLKDNTIDVLKRLKENYKLGILTNGDSFSQHNKIIQTNLEPYFDEIIVSGDIGINKPNKKIFDLMADKLNVKNDECMMIGDTYSTDILGAIRANMIPVWILINPEIPNKYYKGYRINNLEQIFDILKESS